MIRFAVPMAFAAALLLGCGGTERDAAAAAAAPEVATASPTHEVAQPGAPPQAAAAARGRTIKTVGSQFGRILADGRGQAVYLFDKERTRTSECYGACAQAWPPVLTKGRPVAGKGARALRLGTTRRRDGSRQVTMDGRPLYYYVRDSPGRVLCHNVREFGGLWLVVRPDGTPAP